jgi:transcriptional regulator with XRE-family HTH domain
MLFFRKLAEMQERRMSMTGNVNTKKLRAKMIERDITMHELSRRIKIDPSTMSRKIKGSNGFTVGEMQAIANELNLSSGEAVDIFLPSYSHLCEN